MENDHNKQAKHEQQQPKQSQASAAPAAPPPVVSSNQRIPSRMICNRKGSNTEVRDGKCYILFRSELDPRSTRPQLIDENIIDRSRVESLNLQNTNPDVPKRTQVKCICTRLLTLSDDWYALTHDGTVLCNTCARCFRCFSLCFTTGRKLTSVDGFVLCNTCMLSYGRYRKPKFRIKVQPLPKTLDDMEVEMAKQQEKKEDSQLQIDDGHNSELLLRRYNSENYDGQRSYSGSTFSTSIRKKKNNKNRSNSIVNANSNANNISGGLGGVDKEPAQPIVERFRDEGRRPLRRILYPNPRPENYGRPDYRFETPPYMGVDRNTEGQTCPECNQQALAQALVVPGIARVYHERSFRCGHCKKPMHMGYQTPRVQFVACSCVHKVTIWCQSPACEMARMAHHAEKNCHLEPWHPGGRPKRDVPGFLPRYDPAVYRNTATRDEKPKQSGQKK